MQHHHWLRAVEAGSVEHGVCRQIEGLIHTSLLKRAPLNRWERACSRRRGHIQHTFRLLYRFREQARSHG
ncbi:hypothetical protein CXQ82_07925 [Pseudomonas sp. S09G 359]|nr:hypothetical protein CXQ82_07925 [Pseudomonas sp. S09G 359]